MSNESFIRAQGIMARAWPTHSDRDIRMAPDAELLRIPGMGRKLVATLRVVLGTIPNATLHRATPEQQAAGVFDMSDAQEFARLLTWTATRPSELPDAPGLVTRARKAVEFIAHEAPPGSRVMIGGAPWLMPVLVTELRRAGYTPVFAFSNRESLEEARPDGSVVKRTVFRHVGFVPAIV